MNRISLPDGAGVFGLAIWLSCLAMPMQGALADRIFVDDMSDTAYTGGAFNLNDLGANPADTSSMTYELQDTGGNPEWRMFVEHTLDMLRDDPGNNGNAYLQSFVKNENFVYNPAIDGHIFSITYSIDYRTTGPIGDVYFVLGEGNSGYFLDGSFISNDGEWHTLETTYTRGDIRSLTVDFAGTEDFRFGFGMASSLDVTDGPEVHSMSFDNFRVTVTAVPEPTGAGCLWLGCAALSVFRRRRRASASG